MSRKPLSICKEEIESAITNSVSMLAAADLLGIKFSSFKRYAEKFNLYNPNPGLNGTKKPYKGVRTVLAEVLTNSAYTSSTKLKILLYKAGLKENRCEDCGIVSWNNKDIVCHLDHVDGNPRNNELINLRIVCPNCHSQTPTYCRGHNRIKK